MHPESLPEDDRSRGFSPDDFTLGVEEEFQLVDPASGELRSLARDVLDVDWSDTLVPDLQQTMVEVGSRICRDAAGVDAELRRLRMQVAAAAASQELSIASAGVHPFSRWELQQVTATERYQKLLERFGRIVRTEHVFGLHVHVAVPEEIDRMWLIRRLSPYLPHLVALAASSPMYEGEETGFASYRTILASRLPNSGVPPGLESEEEYARWADALLAAGALQDPGSVYWSLRPHSRFPTVEFRAMDACPRVEDAVALAAFVRALTVAACRGDLEPSSTGISAAAGTALVRSNEWHAARDGLDAILADPARSGSREPMRDAIRRALERVGSAAAEMGDAAAIAGVETILERGNGAERIRSARNRLAPGDPPGELVRWITGESLLGLGLDRRDAQRTA